MQSHASTIFVGIKVNKKLRDQLDSSNTSMKPLFEENNPDYLQVIQIGSNEYIGKVTESGTSFEALSNISINVKTMLKMIYPNFTYPDDDALKVHAFASIPVRTLQT